MNNTASTTQTTARYKTNSFVICLSETSPLLPYVIKLLQREYESLVNALDNYDYEAICKIGQGLIGRGKSYGLQRLISLGNLLKIEAQNRNRYELKFLIDRFPSFINNPFVSR